MFSSIEVREAIYQLLLGKAAAAYSLEILLNSMRSSFRDSGIAIGMDSPYMIIGSSWSERAVSHLIELLLNVLPFSSIQGFHRCWIEYVVFLEDVSSKRGDYVLARFF